MAIGLNAGCSDDDIHPTDNDVGDADLFQAAPEDIDWLSAASREIDGVDVILQVGDTGRGQCAATLLAEPGDDPDPETGVSNCVTMDALERAGGVVLGFRLIVGTDFDVLFGLTSSDLSSLRFEDQDGEEIGLTTVLDNGFVVAVEDRERLQGAVVEGEYASGEPLSCVVLDGGPFSVLDCDQPQPA